MREDLRFKFIRGIYERLVLSEYLYCKAYQGQILSLSNLIVQLTIRNHAVRSVGQATHLLSGVGNLAKSCLISIEEDKYLSKSPSEDDKQPSILAAALVALLENIEAYRIKPNCVTQNAGAIKKLDIAQNNFPLSSLQNLLSLILDRLELRIHELVGNRFRDKNGRYLSNFGDLTCDVRYQLGNEFVKGKNRLIIHRRYRGIDHFELTVKGIKLAQNLRAKYMNYAHVGPLYSHVSSKPLKNQILVLMDEREGGGDDLHLGYFADELMYRNVHFATKCLNVGDYQWIRQGSSKHLPLCAERKTIEDLVESLIDGRFYSQISKMLVEKSKFSAFIYIIEGDLVKLSKRFNCPCGMACLFKHSEPPITERCIKNIILELECSGFAVILTSDLRASMSFVSEVTMMLLNLSNTNLQDEMWRTLLYGAFENSRKLSYPIDRNAIKPLTELNHQFKDLRNDTVVLNAKSIPQKRKETEKNVKQQKTLHRFLFSSERIHQQYECKTETYSPFNRLECRYEKLECGRKINCRCKYSAFDAQVMSYKHSASPVRVPISFPAKDMVKKREIDRSYTNLNKNKKRKITISELKKELRDKGLSTAGSKSEMLSRSLLPAYGPIYLTRKREGRWVPRDRTCMFAILCVFDRERRKGQESLKKREVMRMAAQSGVLINPKDMWGGDRGFTGLVCDSYNGWSNVSKAKEGDFPILVRCKKRRGEDEIYRLTKNDSSEDGVRFASELHHYAHLRNWCNCSHHPQ